VYDPEPGAGTRLRQLADSHPKMRVIGKHGNKFVDYMRVAPLIYGLARKRGLQDADGR